MNSPRYSKIAFISGPYRACGDFTVLENIRSAERVAIATWQAGYIALCPHLNTAHFDGLLPDSAWLSGGMLLLARCDLVVTVDGWEESAGATHEVEWARRHGMPVYTVDTLPHISP